MHHGPEFTVVIIAAVALCIGAGMRIASAWSRFPYTIGMLLAGIGIGLFLEHAPHGWTEHGPLELIGHGASISPHLIIFVFLPALVFESAYAIDVHTFKNNLGAIVVLAVPALVASTLMVAAAMVGLTSFSWHWGWPAALVFGALISATDPVAVVAILRELGVSKRLGVLIEGESLLNDGTSIVVFTVLLGLLTGETQSFSLGGAVLSFAWVVAGGMAVGIGLALLLSFWIDRLFNDPLSEITLTLVLAYLAMIVAEGLLHVSGVMAVVSAGLWMSGAGKTKISPEVSHFLHRFWETLGFIANTLIFFLVGLVIAKEIEQATVGDLVLVLVAYVAAMLIRFALTYASQPLANRWSDGVSLKDAAVMSWGGLRGAVSLALGLVISQHPQIDPDLRRQILLVTAGVVLLTILVNGSTIGKLLAWFGFDKPSLSAQLAELSARAHVLGEVREAIDEVSRSRDLKAVPWGDVQERLEGRRQDLGRKIEGVQKELRDASEHERESAHWGRVLGLERQAYWRAFAQGTLAGNATQTLTRELDRQLDRINRGDLQPPETRVPESAGTSLFSLGGSASSDFDRLTVIYDLSRAEGLAAERVVEALKTLPGIDADTGAKIRETYRGYLRKGKERIEDMRTNLPEIAAAIETRLAGRIELNFEREGYERLAEAGVLDEEALHAELHHVEHRMQAQRRGATRVPIPETAELVASTPLFASLDESALELLADITAEKVVPAGQYLFQQGQKGDSLFVIARGAVHVIVQVKGEDLIVDVLGGGDILGEMSLLTGAPRTASARAATSVTVGEVSREGFSKLMAAQPELAERIWGEFGKRRFDNLCRDLPEFSDLDHDQRLAWYDSGQLVTLAVGSGHEVDGEYAYVFVISGTVRGGRTEYPAPSLFSLGVLSEVEAVAEARFVLLADPASVLSPRSARAPVSVIAKGLHGGD